MPPPSRSFDSARWSPPRAFLLRRRKWSAFNWFSFPRNTPSTSTTPHPPLLLPPLPFLLPVLLQPLDVLKTRLQQHHTTPPSSLGGTFTSNRSPSLTPITRTLSEFRVWRALGTIYRSDGMLSLWRGVAPSLARVGLGSGTYFVSLSELQRMAAEYRGTSSLMHAHNFAIGAAARVIASTLVAPITVLKTRLEAADSVHRSGFDITRHMLQQHPLRAAFAGLVPTLCRDAPYSGLYVAIYAHVRSVLPDFVPSTVPSPVINFTSGAVAGLFATMVTQAIPPPPLPRTLCHATPSAMVFQNQSRMSQLSYSRASFNTHAPLSTAIRRHKNARTTRGQPAQQVPPPSLPKLKSSNKSPISPLPDLCVPLLWS